ADGERGRGVYVGGWTNPKTGNVHYLRHDGPEHVAALAPTRAGKGVGLVLPTLLSWPHSVFVYDTKGENHAASAGWRRAHANNVILRFDPGEPDAGCRFNPLNEVRFRTRYQVSDVQNIALMLVDTDGKGIAHDHFLKAAFGLLTGLILHALYKGLQVGRTPSLTNIGEMLSGVGDFAAPDSDEDEDSDGDAQALKGLFEEMRDIDVGDDEAAQEARLVISGTGKQMLGTPARELGSIISTAVNCLSLYRDPIIAKNLSHSDFTVADLMDHDRPVSLFFIVSPGNKDRLRPLVRLMLMQIVRGLVRDSMSFDEGRAKTAHKHRLLLLLDEFPSLGRLDWFEEALAYIAGYGIKAYLIMQDIPQLTKAYTREESVLSNCHVRVAYAPNKIETAEWMSRMTGTATIIKEKITVSGKRFGSVLDNVSTSYDEQQRPLLTPDECMRLPGPVKDKDGNILAAGELLVFAAGHAPIRGTQILYFLDETLSARSRIAPPATSDVIRSEPYHVTPSKVEAFRV
ncbi:type IV secretory system conjugative DNA transfer family protein, partial [Xanthomonas phaseoli]